MARLLWEVGRRSFRRATTYRLATASGVFVNTVFGYLRASVLVAVATAAGGTVGGMETGELVTFAFVSQGFIMVSGAFGETELAERVRSGDVVIDLYRPADLQAWWLATWLGNVAFQALARGVPPVLLGSVAFDLVLPDSAWQWVAFVVSALLASLAGFTLRFISNLSTFWLLDNRGVDQSLTLLIMFFAGMLLPINLFPPWLETTARLLPFASLIQVPTELFVGARTGWDAAASMAQQLFWVAALALIGRAVLAAATRRVVVQGG
jgi:ABC-2 type transport system permease protein